MQKKVFQLTHYDLDGVVCHIILQNASKNQIISFQCGYGKKEKTIKRLIKASKKFESCLLFITDFCLLKEEILELSKHFVKIIYIDHHEDSNNMLISGFFDSISNITPIINIKKSASLLIYLYFEKKLENRFSIGSSKLKDLKRLVILSNDYDLWIHKYKSSWGLDKLFWLYKWESFVSRFIDGYDELRFNEITYIKTTRKQQVRGIKKQEKITISNIALIMITSPGIGDSLTGDLTIFVKKYKYYFIYQPDKAKVSIRARSSNVNISLAMEKVLSKIERYVHDYGGHKLAGAFILLDKANKPDNIIKIISKILELLEEMDEKK